MQYNVYTMKSSTPNPKVVNAKSPKEAVCSYYGLYTPRMKKVSKQEAMFCVSTFSKSFYFAVV